MTSFELVVLEHEGLQFHGLVTGRQHPRLAIHVHGTWGNFYANPIATYMADTYARHGVGFASVNVPGFDNNSEREDFDASLPALAAWVRQLGSGKEIIWQGHSLGALKVMKLHSSPAFESTTRQTKAMILLAPFDLPAFYAQADDNASIADKRTTAERACAEGLGDELVGPSVFGVWPVSWATYARALQRGGPWDLVPTAVGDVGLLASPVAPTMALVGSEDVAAHPDPKSVVGLLMVNAPSVTARLIEGAPHNFAGREPEVESIIDSFLTANLQ